MISIQSRLAAGLLISLIVLLLAQWIIVAVSIRHLSEQFVSSRLMHSADTLVAAVVLKPQGSYILDEARIDPVFSTPFSGYYYQLTVNGHSVRSRSLWDETLPMTDTRPGQFESRRILGPQQQNLLLVSSAYQKQGNIINIAVAENISAITENINALLIRHAFVSLLILVILVALQVFIVRRSLKPLDNTRDDLEKLENGAIQALDEAVPTEIKSLVHEINMRVTAFQQRLERSRRATGNLAHALKAPLTLLAQSLQNPAIQQSPGLRDALQENIASIQNIINRELKRARLAGTVVGARQTSLKPDVTALVKSLQSMYREKNLDIDVQLPDSGMVNMDREDFHEMLGNILDNACKWARHNILVKISCHSGLLITVDDDGPGIPEAARETILARGQRLDEQTAGHGLGLAIVKDIVDQYQGHITMGQPASHEGLRVTVNIPTGSRRIPTKETENS